jgi:hypothetical protein
MIPTLNFCFDSLSDPDLGYPNLAKLNLGPEDFDCTWPRTLPVRLFAYFPMAGQRHRSWLVKDAPAGSWYPVGLAWHDFDLDYFALLSDACQQRVRARDVKLLFYYHEGDNPQRIRDRFEHLRCRHNFPRGSYVFLSANSASDQIEDFIYWPDHEIFFQYINRHQQAWPVDATPRNKDFVALNRTHKWWRAACMADLHRSGVLENSTWSYNPLIDIGDQRTDNPICVGDLPGLSDYLDNFLCQGPYRCDNLDDIGQNDHRFINDRLYKDAYCHLILETHFDADQSNGTFITEKTYKCLKFGQPFVVIGPPGTLKALRERGYRVFDHAIDNSYDDITDNTRRWRAVKHTIETLKQQDLHHWFESCVDDVRWNQHHFMHGHAELLDQLVLRLDQLSTVTP